MEEKNTVTIKEARAGEHFTVSIPEGTAVLDPCAFFEQPLKTVILPGSLKEIGDCAFYGCAELEEVIIPDGSALLKIGDSAFYGCGKLRRCKLPRGI